MSSKWSSPRTRHSAPVIAPISQPFFTVLPLATARRPTAASRTLADQLQPIVRLRDSIRRHGYAQIDVERARARILVGRTGFDADVVLRSATDLARAFSRTAAAFEHAGMEGTPRVSALHAMSVDAVAQVLAWANTESLPVDPMLRVARKVAAVVGNAVLSRVASDVMSGFSLPPWKWPQCPCCSASPDLSLTSDTGRTLVCWRCDTHWQTQLRGCLGCGASAPPAIARVGSPYLGYELAICGACGRYLKERRGPLTHDLIVERALVAGLDEAARQRGLRS